MYLLKDGPLRYGELRRQMIDISKKMLTQQIRELERDDIVDRKVSSADPGGKHHGARGRLEGMD